MREKVKRAYVLTLTVAEKTEVSSCLNWVKRTVKKVDDNAIVEVLTSFEKDISMLILIEEDYFSDTKGKVASVVARMSCHMTLDNCPLDKIQDLGASIIST